MVELKYAKNTLFNITQQKRKKNKKNKNLLKTRTWLIVWLSADINSSCPMNCTFQKFISTKGNRLF